MAQASKTTASTHVSTLNGTATYNYACARDSAPVYALLAGALHLYKPLMEVLHYWKHLQQLCHYSSSSVAKVA
eukprot:14947-Heterococcus_DN1.PRE.2